MEQYRLAVVGSRTFADYKLLKKTLNQIAPNISTLISGGATGADSLAEKWADEHKIEKLIFHAQWDDLEADGAIIKTNKYGKKYNANAGFARNKTIVDNCDALVAFWDGKSRGTKDSIDYARKLNRKIKVVIFKT